MDPWRAFGRQQRSSVNLEFLSERTTKKKISYRNRFLREDKREFSQRQARWPPANLPLARQSSLQAQANWSSRRGFKNHACAVMLANLCSYFRFLGLHLGEISQ